VNFVRTASSCLREQKKWRRLSGTAIIILLEIERTSYCLLIFVYFTVNIVMKTCIDHCLDCLCILGFAASCFSLGCETIIEDISFALVLKYGYL